MKSGAICSCQEPGSRSILWLGLARILPVELRANLVTLPGRIPFLPHADAASFGQTLAKLRLARGYTQSQVVGRILTYYRDASTYGRIERGERHPDRDAAIAILIQGLLIE